MATRPISPEDLAHVLQHAEKAFLSLRDANLFITGGTGFFGHWLLESLLHADHEFALNLRATVLTRNAAAFRAKSPHIANSPAITLLEGDIRTFAFPTAPHTHILHAATDSGGQQTSRTPEDLYNDILAGTQHVLDFTHYTHTSYLTPHTSTPTTPPRLLYTSTGAVYGRSTTLLHTPETFPVPNLPLHSYESAKRAAEDLCLASLNARSGYPDPLGSGLIETKEIGALAPGYAVPVIARCFAFVGPHLPLDAHFAIGNFLGAALHSQPIHIKGDGTPRRSWLYMADLAIWLWTLLTHGQPGSAYNVGSDAGMTIAEAAALVQKTCHPEPSPKDLIPIQIDGTLNPNAPLNSYVPDITRATTELNLKVTIPLTEALHRTAAWHTKAR